MTAKQSEAKGRSLVWIPAGLVWPDVRGWLTIEVRTEDLND